MLGSLPFRYKKTITNPDFRFYLDFKTNYKLSVASILVSDWSQQAVYLIYFIRRGCKPIIDCLIYLSGTHLFIFVKWAVIELFHPYAAKRIGIQYL